MSAIKIKTSEAVTPMIYAYTTPGIVYHDGWTKIGYTERDVDLRIKEQTRTANIVAKKEWQDVAIFSDGKTRFTDKEFHAYLSKNDIERKEPQPDDEGCPEWFKISGGDSFDLFTKFRHDLGILQTLGVKPYTLRAEQKAAVSGTYDYFLANSAPEFLWNAKPRFGKTLSAYDLCKRLKAKKILIVTNRPSIANSWYEDYVNFLGTESGYYFVSNVEDLRGKKYVLSREQYTSIISENGPKGCIEFISLQDLKGSIHFGGMFDKLSEVAQLFWDVLIVDEAHEAIDTYKTNVAFDQIKRKYTLHLSGTPFKALANNKFPEQAIFNWTYADEQTAKRNWAVTSELENPYADLPQLNLFTYKMSDIVRERAEQGADFDNDGDMEAFYWDLNEFFKTKADGKFIHEAAVDKFLDALNSQEKFPFSTEELRGELKHTLWILKYISSAKALAKKLGEHPLFKDYKIVLVAGDGKLDDDGESSDEKVLFNNIKTAYAKVKDGIAHYDKTITISVGSLITGITVPEWSGVLMLSNMKSSALYIQAAFRAQNPCLFNIDGVPYRKKNAYVFDFDPARTLQIMEDFANGLHPETANGKGDSDLRKQHVRELLNFFPIYGEDDGGEMIELNAEKVLSIPRTIHAREVVRCGFMNNFLFQNIANIFSAPQSVLDILQKIAPSNDSIGVTSSTKNELDIDDNGEVKVPEAKVIGTANEVFGGKILGDIETDLVNTVDDIRKNKEKTAQKDEKLDKLLATFREKVTDKLVEKAKSHYGSEMSKSTQQALVRKINTTADSTVKKHYGNYRIQNNLLEAERKKQIEAAQSSGRTEQIPEIHKAIDKKKERLETSLFDAMREEVKTVIKEASETIVNAVEQSKQEKKRDEIMDGIRAHLRGFSRTIPSFLMGYGDANTTLENFDKIIPDEVFLEVTSISLDEFRRLRDGFEYTDENGMNKRYNGFFDPIVFNDSVKEFLRLKRKLANYFEDDQTEDIFDYIPPQKTNQIFTPKKVVKQMVDNLERENPGCFDDPDHTFADLYMKSGLYITEIVKRLFRSEKIKALFPDERARLNHIFEKQVYGFAPTEIIYRIATAFILGFSDDIKIERNNLRLLDTLPYAQNGTLSAKLDELFGKY